MSNEELAAAIAAVDGRVLIGFKNADAADGVDNDGRVLASDGAVAAGRGLLEQIGARVQYEFRRMPAVAAVIRSEAVAALRASPLIDYLEPSSSGKWDTQVTPWGSTPCTRPPSGATRPEAASRY